MMLHRIKQTHNHYQQKKEKKKIWLLTDQNGNRILEAVGVTEHSW